jgi:hypothetical protein
MTELHLTFHQHTELFRDVDPVSLVTTTRISTQPPAARAVEEGVPA